MRALVAALLVVSVMPVASAGTTCAPGDGACLSEGTFGDPDCATPRSTGSRSTVVWIVQAPVFVLVHGASGCERGMDKSPDSEVHGHAVSVVVQSDAGGLYFTWGESAARTPDGDSSQCEIALAATDAQHQTLVGWQRVVCPVGPPDAGWGHVLP